jgi:methyltransferase (TIGR00027 family)
MPNVNPVNETAYYCCGVRMQDAASRQSIINDRFAMRFMDNHGRNVFAQFKHLKRSHMACVARCRIIDDYLRQALLEDLTTQVVVIGAGFDTKAFRIPGGIWYEIDEKPIIAKKNEALKESEAANPLKRIVVDFAKQELNAALAILDKNLRTIFVIEGVLMYLDEKTINSLIATLNSTLKSHLIICDLMSENFIKAHMKTFLKTLDRFDCHFKFHHKNPEEFFIERGYAIESTTSILERGYSLTRKFMPKAIMQFFKPHLFSGYGVYCLAI